MVEYDTIVVPLDGSTTAARAIPVARAVAARLDARIVLLAATPDGGATMQQVAEETARLGDVEVATLAIAGRPRAESVLEVALAEEGRLVCLSSRGRRDRRGAVVGHVADEVIRAGVVPVLVVGPSCDLDAIDHPGAIELCVDGSSRSLGVVEAGRQWARLLGREVHLVIVVDPLDAVSGLRSDELFGDLRRPFIADGLHAPGTCTYCSSVPEGLVIEAERLGSPLMVISSAPRAEVGGEHPWTTVLGILDEAPCPVLVTPLDPRAASTAAAMDLRLMDHR